ncbi:hypothetical protein KPL70_014259 [Citrus sinensis]|nr:hypothetical protein KPL70_014259 [Citrus sinensis]
MPLEWLTNYEHFHQNLEPVQTIEATFNRRPNGQVKLSFQTPNTQPVSNSPQLSYTAMITAVQTGKEKKLPIHGFSSEGYPVYLDKVNGHFLWDVPEAHMCNPDCPCLDDTDIDKELEIMRRKKKKKKKSSYPSSSCKSFPPHPPPDPKPPTQPSLFTQSQPTPVSPPFFETYSPFYTPSRPQQPVYNKFFRFSHLQPTPQPSSPKKARSKPETHNSCSSSSYDSSNASTNSESEYADITGILMASETADPSASTSTPIVADNPSDQASQTEPIPLPVHEHLIKPSSTSWFTFDDIPRHKWAARLQEFAAWIDLQADRKEYHQMKCCSLKRHLLDAHYKRMSILFYKLNGFNEPSLKHVFIVSLPPELQPNLQRKLTATNLSIVDISLGKIFQMAMLSLDKICEQKEFFKDLMEDKKPFSEACKKPYLKIECKDEKKCVCPTTKKRHFQKHFHRKSSSKKPFRYFKKKDVSQYRKKKSNRCFICKKSGHFARNCPYKPAKAVRLIQHLQHFSLLSENDDVKSNFSVQSTQDDQTAFLIAESSDSEDISVISTVQTVNHVSTIPRPSLKMSILPSKFHKHIPVIGFIDIGADTNTLRLYALSETPSPYSHISQKLLEFYPENHSQFHHPSPLWKNEQFFIHLPFKLNEDINPTKASHPGMSPSDLLLAKQECSQLLQQGLIESTDSDWACQAFYVEKRSELVRGKKRLVIDY